MTSKSNSKKDNLTNLKNTIEFYNSFASDYADKTESLSPIEEISTFANLMKRGEKVLDVGCAAGRDSRILQQLHFKVTGIDISSCLLAEANKRSKGIKFIKMDMRKLKFPDNIFDGIYSSASLLHLLTLKDVKKTLSEFRKVLKSSGIVHIRVKAQKGKNSSEYIKEDKSGYKSRFTRYFTEESLKKIVESAKFKIIKLYTYNGRKRMKTSRDIDWIVVFARNIT